MMRKIYLLLSICLIVSCNQPKDKAVYKGQELHRLVTMVSYCQYIDTLAAWKDTSCYFVNKAGEPIMVNSQPLFVKRKGTDSLQTISHLLRYKGKTDTTYSYRIIRGNLVRKNSTGFISPYLFTYDDKNRLVKAITYATDTYQYKFKWVGNLLTDIIMEGGYYSRTFRTHIEYDKSQTIPQSGLPALLDGAACYLFMHPSSNAYLLTGYMGRLPNSPVKKMTTKAEYGKTLAAYNVKTTFDKTKRITSYALVKPNGMLYVKQDFYYPD